MRILLLNVALTATAASAFPQAPTPQNGQRPGQQWPQQGWSAQEQRQSWATEKLAQSPRRNEWVTIKNGNRTLKAWVDYPDAEGKVPVVLVLHEVFGLTDSTRNTADQIAAMGYIAITPDLLSGFGPNGGNADSFEPPLSASQTVTNLPDEVVDSDLNAWANYGKKLPQSNGEFAIVGLSWGGGAAFRYVTTAQRNDLKVVFVLYDVGPPTETQRFSGAPAALPVANIKVPVYGFYGSRDTRATSSVAATKDAMAAAGKFYDPVIYEGADHAFMRAGEDPDNKNQSNVDAMKMTLARIQQVLKQKT